MRKRPTLRDYIAHLLCRLGLHDDRVIGANYGFSPGTGTERVECRRCGRVAVRHPR